MGQLEFETYIWLSVCVFSLFLSREECEIRFHQSFILLLALLGYCFFVCYIESNIQTNENNKVKFLKTPI